MNPGAGILYVVATPIGNLEDLSSRAEKILAGVDLVLCEDTRRSLKLLNHLGLRKRLESFNEHNQAAKIPRVMARLASGQKIALATDAGTPALSDPGASLVRACHQALVKVIPIPGPSALTAALSASGMKADRFLFLGFLPSKSSERKKILQAGKSFPETLVVFEAPHRLAQTAQDLREILGDRQLCFCRELTKVFEQVNLTSLSKLSEQMKGSTAKGEITLVIAGAEIADKSRPADSELEELLRAMLKRGMTLKEIARGLSREPGLSKNLVYQKALALKNRCGNS